MGSDPILHAVTAPKRRTPEGAGPVQVAIKHRTWAEQYAEGKALRAACPRGAHAAWKAPRDRRDAVELILAAEKGRMPDLLPLRHGRMVRSPFTFYRGAALTMAADLAVTPSTGVYVQCCGDAHLCNFGGFATPERKIIFAINDLDETLPAPWEWDVKRLAASFVVASRDNGLTDAAAIHAAMACARSYRESMAEFSQLKTLELWYRALGTDELFASLPLQIRKRALKRIEKERAKSRGEELFPKLAEQKGGRPVIKDQLPTIFHHKDHPPGEVQQILRHALTAYRATLPVTDINATVETPSVGVGRSFSLFGQTAQAFGALPYSWAQMSGKALGEARSTTRAGLSDMRLRLSVLVRGAPVASVAEFAKAPRRTILGTSLTVVGPTGQFFPDRLVNLGANRWAFKPEFAVSQPMGQKWLLDVYTGLWLFTENDSFYPSTSLREQAPMGVIQTHLSYSIRRQLHHLLHRMADGVVAAPHICPLGRAGKDVDRTLMRHLRNDTFTLATPVAPRGRVPPVSAACPADPGRLLVVDRAPCGRAEHDLSVRLPFVGDPCPRRKRESSRLLRHKPSLATGPRVRDSRGW